MIQGSGSEAIIIVTAVFLAISFITVCLRCYVRLRVVRAFGWDDGFMVMAMVSISLPVKRHLLTIIS